MVNGILFFFSPYGLISVGRKERGGKFESLHPEQSENASGATTTALMGAGKGTAKALLLHVPRVKISTLLLDLLLERFLNSEEKENNDTTTMKEEMERKC